jgi:hypothetical protein
MLEATLPQEAKSIAVLQLKTKGVKAMNRWLTMAAAATVMIATPAFAETGGERPVTKAPTKTMGDSGKLPATSTTNSAVPDMTGSQPAGDPVGEDGRKRMGDSGKLPATGATSNAVPDMTAPSDGK